MRRVKKVLKLDFVQLVRLDLPLQSAPGNFEEVVGPESDSLSEGEKFWDVCVINGKIVTTVHACQRQGGRIHVYDMSGKLEKLITCEWFNEPNMMAVFV